MHKGQSINREVKRQRRIVLDNPETKEQEHYQKSARGKWLRGGESLHLENLVSRAQKYADKAAELADVENKKKIQERARKLESNETGS